MSHVNEIKNELDALKGMQQGMRQFFDFLNSGHSLEEAKKKFLVR